MLIKLYFEKKKINESNYLRIRTPMSKFLYTSLYTCKLSHIGERGEKVSHYKLEELLLLLLIDFSRRCWHDNLGVSSPPPCCGVVVLLLLIDFSIKLSLNLYIDRTLLHVIVLVLSIFILFSSKSASSFNFFPL